MDETEQGPRAVYLCGQCGAESTLSLGKHIRCEKCGYRVFYKKRTKDLLIYDAR